jgi:hypothetical protein
MCIEHIEVVLMERKFSLEVERRIGVSKVTLRREVTESEDISETIRALNAELDKAVDVNTLSNSASIQPPVSMPFEVSPAPQLIPLNIPEMPQLTNPPHSYPPTEAIDEILDPQKSVWARQPRTTKEIQKHLMDIGVRGVSNIQTLDGRLRSMHGQGRVRREKIDGVYKYYRPGGGAS